MDVTTGACPVDWTAVADGWERKRAHVEAMKAELTERMLAGLELADGCQVLELGSGTGELAAALAQRVAPSGRVIASDVAPGMVDVIKRTLAGANIEAANVEVVQLDARDVARPDDSADAVVFRMGLMLVDEPAVALAQIRRVLRPGGRFAAAVWAGPEANPWLTTVGMAAMMHGLAAGPPVGPGTPFSLSDPDRLETLVREAGFAEVTVAPVDTLARFASVDEHVDTIMSLAPPLGRALSTASDETLAAVRQTVAGLTEQFRSGAGLAIPGRALLCLAR